MRSSKDSAAHTKLKYRTGNQIVDGDKRRLVEESLRKLEEAERERKRGKVGMRTVDEEDDRKGEKKMLTMGEDAVAGLGSKYGDEDDGEEDSDEEEDLDNIRDSDSDDSDDDDDSDSEDEEELLRREMEKIKAERAEKERIKEEQEAREREALATEAAMTGNPLLNDGGKKSGKMKRKWNDDVVFRNQARTDVKTEKRFVNDTVRNDFHKRFINKFMK